jgi:hypothetical protein
MRTSYVLRRSHPRDGASEVHRGEAGTIHQLGALAPPKRRLRGTHRPLAWLLAHLRSVWLDNQLASGASPWQSPTRAARALQLTGDRQRRTLARSLERLAEDADRPAPPFRGAVITPCRQQVREALPLILALASRLRRPEPVAARGVARLNELVSDGTGPCYLRSHPQTLTLALETVMAWLDVPY